MALVKKQVTVQLDTDSFSQEEWLDFIKQYVSPTTILRIIKTDLYPFELLKEKAVLAYRAAAEFEGKSDL